MKLELQTYLKNRKIIRVPLVNPGLTQIHHIDGNVGAFGGDHRTRGSTHIPGPDTADFAYFYRHVLCQGMCACRNFSCNYTYVFVKISAIGMQTK